MIIKDSDDLLAEDLMEDLVATLKEAVQDECRRELFYVKLYERLGIHSNYLDFMREEDPAINGAFFTVRALAGRTYGLERKV